MMANNDEDKHSIDSQEMLGLIKQLNFTIDKLKNKNSEAIAIVGMSCRFPGGANSIEEYWQLLINGTDAISEVPQDRWSLDEYYNPDPNMPGKMYCKWGGFLNVKIQDFDSKFFDIVPLEAQMMDPQQRLALEVTWEALENANICIDDLNGSLTGVFFGVSTSDYVDILKSGLDIIAYTNSGLGHSVLAGRISYELGLQGPSLVLDTACSSSLVAIHQACASLRKGESNLAIAGGVNLMLTPDLTIGFCKGKFLADDGRCKTFDETANGYVRGEGCGVIILKRLSDALQDGDDILSIIKGSAVNQDGASGGLTVPNGPAQEIVIRQALQDANVKPNAISYIEAHGTGTSLGDPIEVNALGKVLKDGRDKENELIIASVKTNIGHLEAAAGMASIIKVILALQNQEIPKHLHFNQLNHNITVNDSIKFTIPTENIKWQRGDHKRIAGVSGFAFQGTNAHVIIEEAPSLKKDSNQISRDESQLERPWHILAISAKNKNALYDLSKAYINKLNNNKAKQNYLANLSYTANGFRTKFSQRMAVISKDAVDAKNQLQRWLETGEANHVIIGEALSNKNPKTAFLFTGQSSQYAGMGKKLYETSHTFKKFLDIAAKILEENDSFDKPLLSVLWGSDSNLINDTKYTQPALFAIEYALAQLWLSWGIKPNMVIGHSVGEYVAACIAGVFSLEDGLKLIAKRASLMQALSQNGAMAAIAVSESIMLDALKSYKNKISIAAVNGPENIVISGDSDAVKELAAKFINKGIKTKELQVSHAFHSHLLEPMLDAFKMLLLQINFAKPNIPLISNLTGNIIADEEIIKPSYWLQHTREAVRFNDGVKYLIDAGVTNFIEIGPQPILLGMVQEAFIDLDPKVFLPSLRKDKDDWEQILLSLGKAYVAETVINWKDFDKDYTRKKVSLPTYPFQRQRHWIESKLSKASDGEVVNYFYDISWVSSVISNDVYKKVTDKEVYLIFVDSNGIGQELIDNLTSIGMIVFSVHIASDLHSIEPTLGYLQLNENSFSMKIDDAVGFNNLLFYIKNRLQRQNFILNKIIYCWDLNVSNNDELNIENTQKIVYGGALLLTQSIVSQKLQDTRLYFVTQRAQSVTGKEDYLCALQSPLWGFSRTVAIEIPYLSCTIIDLDKSATPLLDEILSNDIENEVAYRDNERFVCRLTSNNTVMLSRLSADISSAGTYLITGGLGALGHKIVAWLINKGAKYIVLVGRNAPSTEIQEIINIWRNKEIQISTFEVDISNFNQVKKILDLTQQTMPKLSGVIHAAGVMEDADLTQQNWDKYKKIMNSKILGAYNLQKILNEYHLSTSLDFFVSFSSMASIMGNIGQSNYAAANAFLDSLAFYQRVNNIPGFSINWGPWASVGLAANMDKASQEQMDLAGINSISPEVGISVLETILLDNVTIPEIAVIDINWQRFLSNTAVNETFYSNISSRTHNQIQHRDNINFEIIKKLTHATLQEKTPILSGFLESEIKAALGIDTTTHIDNETSFASLGMDSLMAVEFRNKLTKVFGTELHEPLSATMLISYPNIAKLTEYLLKNALQLIPLDKTNSITRKEKSWITIPVPRPNAKVRLLCFLYMGGNIDAYYPWAQTISSDIEICCVAPFSDFYDEATCRDVTFSDLLEQMAIAIKPYIITHKFSLFGHSMGAAVAFEFARYVDNNYQLLPNFLFLSSLYTPPKFYELHKISEQLSEPDFMTKFLVSSGLPHALLDDSAWVAAYQKRVMVDAACMSSYNYDAESALDSAITAFHFNDDILVSLKDVEDWRNYTTTDFKLLRYNGGHFDIFKPKNMAKVIAAIKHQIKGHI